VCSDDLRCVDDFRWSDDFACSETFDFVCSEAVFACSEVFDFTCSDAFTCVEDFDFACSDVFVFTCVDTLAGFEAFDFTCVETFACTDVFAFVDVFPLSPDPADAAPANSASEHATAALMATAAILFIWSPLVRLICRTSGVLSKRETCA
jgi:hypothetical protein